MRILTTSTSYPPRTSGVQLVGRPARDALAARLGEARSALEVAARAGRRRNPA